MGPRIRVEPLHPTQIEQVARIHLEQLSEGFIASLGLPFLKTLYTALLSSERDFCFVALKGDRVLGLIHGCEDTEKMLGALVRSNFFPFFWATGMSFLRHPGLLIKAWGVLSYGEKTRLSGTKAELVSIAIRDGSQGKGLGKILCVHLMKEFARRGFQWCKVGVKADMRANSFYKKMGFKLVKTEELFGKPMNFYRFQCRKRSS